MPDALECDALDVGGEPRPAESRAVAALVWAADDRQAAEAIDHLSHGLWPYWFLFAIVEVRQLPLGFPCPLRQDDPEVLASARRQRWTWVLVPPGSGPGPGPEPGQAAETQAVAPCT